MIVTAAQNHKNLGVNGGYVLSCMTRSAAKLNGGPGRKGSTLPSTPPIINKIAIISQRISISLITLKYKFSVLKLHSIHHIAIICSDYQRSKKFYTEVLGFTVLAEHYRQERQSYKLDLGLGDHYVIELFSFPDPPLRPSRPEARGLRHLAFGVSDLEIAVQWLEKNGVDCEPIRIDAFTGKKFTFFSDPDEQPLEFYEL
jgi:glyoxylase I family protein